MQIYGYKEMVDDRVATLVVAAESVQDYTTFCDTLRQMDVGDEEAKFEEIYTSNFLDALRDERYKGYKHPVLCVYHKDEEQREAFCTQHNVLEVNTATGRDRQADMLHSEKKRVEEETLTDEEKNMTIEERHGLDKNDPWDRRSEEEKAQDEEMKQKMAEARKKGELSGDSFSGAADQRASRERFNGVPLSRTDAIKALDAAYREDPDVTDDDVPDWDSMENDELGRAYQGIDELNAPLRPVFNDDEMPESKEDTGSVHVTKIDQTGEKLVNEDGSINMDAISSVSAVKLGGAVDEELKAAREEAHQAKVDEAKGGKPVFSPGDFAAVLEGDGSADHLSGTLGQSHRGVDRVRRGEGLARPTLSEAAEAARSKHQEETAAREAEAAKVAAATAEIKGKQERDAGIFRGAALDSEGERVTFDDLPEALRKELEEAELKQESYPAKNYPYNSELAGRALFPFDRLDKEGYRVLGGENITIEGAVQMGTSSVAVVSKKDKALPAVVLYGRPSKTTEGQTDIQVVHLR